MSPEPGTPASGADLPLQLAALCRSLGGPEVCALLRQGLAAAEPWRLEAGVEGPEAPARYPAPGPARSLDPGPDPLEPRVLGLPEDGRWPAFAPGLSPGDPVYWLPLAPAGLEDRALLWPCPDALEPDPLLQGQVLLEAARLLLARERAARRTAEARVRRTVREVARIQQALLPDDALRIRGVDIAARLDSFDLAGGDYYDYNALSHHFEPDVAGLAEDHFSVIVADVTGHGTAAAVEAAMVDALLRAYPGDTEGGGPPEVLSFVNRHFFTRRGRSHLVTAFAALFHPPDEELIYCNAGHPPPLLRRARGGVEWIDDGDDIPIGVLADHRFQGATRRFRRGDLLVLYTDGVSEALSPDGEEFGLERLARIVETGPISAGELLAAIRRAVLAHEAGRAPRDDRTLVVVRRRTS